MSYMRHLTSIIFVLLCAVPLAAEDAPEPRHIDTVLKGKVVSLEKDVIEIVYDFKDEAEMEDWIGFKPFRAAGDLEKGITDGALTMKGTGALHHKITFHDMVFVEYELTPKTTRDLGAVVAEDAESEQYVLYCVNDLYFQKWDGGRTPGHMICRFGVKDPSEPEGNKVFRYISRGKKPNIRSHTPLKIVFSKDEHSYTMTIGDREMKGKGTAIGRNFTELHAGFYVIKAQALVRNIRIRGRVSKMWLGRENVKLELSEPLPDPEGPSPEDEAARGVLERYKTGTALTEEVLEVLGNAAVSREIRDEVVLAVVATGHKPIVLKTIPLLYSDDLATRECGIAVVKGLLGKSFGYTAKSDEDRRSSAIQKLVSHIRKRPTEFGSSR